MNNPLYYIHEFYCWKKSKKYDYEKLDRIKQRLAKQKIIVTMCKYLGEGSYGVVFQINKNTVLKVSTDKTEVNTMMIVKNHPSKNIVRVKDVFQCRLGNANRYFIVEEKLKKPNKSWCFFTDYLIDNGINYITQNNVSQFKSNHNKRFKTSRWRWINSIASYFEEYNIMFSDIHSGNIMKKGDNHVLIDLGVSRAPRQRVDIL